MDCKWGQQVGKEQSWENRGWLDHTTNFETKRLLPSDKQGYLFPIFCGVTKRTVAPARLHLPVSFPHQPAGTGIAQRAARAGRAGFATGAWVRKWEKQHSSRIPESSRRCPNNVFALAGVSRANLGMHQRRARSVADWGMVWPWRLRVPACSGLAGFRSPAREPPGEDRSAEKSARGDFRERGKLTTDGWLLYPEVA